MIKNILKGIVIGIANVLPGVSGGTMAVVLNIYDKLTESIGNILTVPLEKKKEYFKFLFQIGLGAGIGILAFAGIISQMYLSYPKMTTVVFLFLIIPSIPIVLKDEKFLQKNSLISFMSGVIFTVLFMYITSHFSGSGNVELGYSNFSLGYGIKLFFCGIIAAGAMIIPGISGSLLLIVLGEYYNILYFIKSFKMQPLIFFSIGVALGIVGVSKIISILLKKYKNYTLNFIVGIIVASLFQIIKSLF